MLNPIKGMAIASCIVRSGQAHTACGLESENCQVLASAVIVRALEDLVKPNGDPVAIQSAKEFFVAGNVDLEFWCGLARLSSGEILRAIKQGFITRESMKAIATRLCYSPVPERYRGQDDEDEAGDPDSPVVG